MPRKPRIEFEGARYHVIGRGNYRKNLFRANGAGESFERALLETAERQHWRVHAFVVMSNHYHVALETPLANLVEGMGRMLGVFATRFNRFHGEQGHVFQGRYQSLVVEPGGHWRGLIDYIHLNPLRAGICEFEKLQEYGPSSYRWYWRKRWPDCLIREEFLADMELPNTKRGMRSYEEYLKTRNERDPKRHKELMKRYSQGWALASKEYQKNILKDHQELEGILERASGSEYEEVRALNWERKLQEWMQKEKQSEETIRGTPKAAKWKMNAARYLRSKTGATNRWIAKRLQMGHPSRVSGLVHGHHKPSIKGTKRE